ncbi:MAG: flagellar basal body rod protein FlgC [Rhodothermales bacterium]
MLINKHTFTVFQTVGRGLESQRLAISAATDNIANATTTRKADGTQYALKRPVHEVPDERYRRFDNLLNKMQSDMATPNNQHFNGTSLRRRLHEVEMGPTTTIEDDPVYRTEYDPTHPHADENGYVSYPDVNVVEEMARLISANRIYDANLSAFQTSKEMIKRTLEI